MLPISDDELAHRDATLDHGAAFAAARSALAEHGPWVDDDDLLAVGHRVVHGGRRFTEPVVVDDDVIGALRTLSPLAPLHNPANVEGTVRITFNGTPTANYAYAAQLALKHGLRTSYQTHLLAAVE